MNQRRWSVRLVVFLGLTCCASLGCRGRQQAHVMDARESDLVGSHNAGSEVYKPLIDEAVAKLLGRHTPDVHQASGSSSDPQQTRICFVAVENKSSEEIGDFKDQIYQLIDSRIEESQSFRPISKRYVEAALRDTRLRPDELFLPKNQRTFAEALEQQGQPFDFLLYATITSGTTRSNADYQREYLLTLEMVNVHTGDYDKESATLRKGYHRSPLAKLRNFQPWK